MRTQKPQKSTDGTDDQYVIRLLAELVNIPSVGPEEHEILLFLEGELRRLGLAPERIPVAEGSTSPG